MKPYSRLASLAAGLCLLAVLGCAVEPAPPAGDDAPAAAPAPGLTSWNDGAPRAAIVEFVARVTDPESPDFVPEAERIAVFDNDGTLWAEKPFYFQLFFALDRMRERAGADPELASREPYRTILDEGIRGLEGMDVHDLLGPLVAALGGTGTEEFIAESRDWLATARHPEREVAYTDLVYQPMLELLEYLRAHGFRTWIVSGGGRDFIRAFSADAYGIPAGQVIGSTLKAEFDPEGNTVMRLPEIDHVNDGPGKPVGIARAIGRRPILAVGNSDGDLEMMQYTDDGSGPALAVYVHHDDAEREWAYDRDSSVGRLDRGLDVAAERGWTVVSMRNDWSSIFPPR